TRATIRTSALIFRHSNQIGRPLRGNSSFEYAISPNFETATRNCSRAIIEKRSVWNPPGRRVIGINQFEREQFVLDHVGIVDPTIVWLVVERIPSTDQLFLLGDRSCIYK